MVTALLIVNLALGILTRAAPQLNIFAVGFPITLMVGMAALMLSLPYFIPVIEQLIIGRAGNHAGCGPGCYRPSVRHLSRNVAVTASIFRFKPYNHRLDCGSLASWIAP